jgi:hypothetical protein
MSTQVVDTILAANPAKHMTSDQLLAEITRLRSENAALAAAKAQPVGKITLKRSKPEGATKGNALCAYGLGRYPVTLYREQWEALLKPEVVAQILAAVKALPTKAEGADNSKPVSGF